MSTSQAAQELGITVDQLLYRVKIGFFSSPSLVAGGGVRYFDRNWLEAAKIILGNKHEGQDE